jgi:hypothetical protein
MTSIFIEPFDFKTIIINYFLGNANLFPFFVILIVSYVCAYLNISNTVYLILLTLGLLMFGAYTGQVIYTLILFLVGFVIFKMFTRIWSR